MLSRNPSIGLDNLDFLGIERDLDHVGAAHGRRKLEGAGKLAGIAILDQAMLLVVDGKSVGACHAMFVAVRVEEDPGTSVVGYGDALLFLSFIASNSLIIASVFGFRAA